MNVLKRFDDNTFNLVLTDPPYIVNYRDRSSRTLPNDTNGHWLKPTFEQIARVLKPTGLCISFYGWSHVEKFMLTWKTLKLRPVGHLVFWKTYPSKTGIVRYQHENAYILAKGEWTRPNSIISDVRPWVYSGNTLHPTQKPLEAMKELIQAFTNPGDLVLDPFMGSGTTLLAAKQLNRRSIGIEIDKGYYQTAKKRLKG